MVEVRPIHRSMNLRLEVEEKNTLWEQEKKRLQGENVERWLIGSTKSKRTCKKALTTGSLTGPSGIIPEKI